LLQLRLILRLFSQWLGWVNQTLLNILLWHVLKHYIYYIDVVQPIRRRKSHKLQRALLIHLCLCFLSDNFDESEKSIINRKESNIPIHHRNPKEPYLQRKQGKIEKYLKFF
jgi:hypothetical protein